MYVRNSLQRAFSMYVCMHECLHVCMCVCKCIGKYHLQALSFVTSSLAVLGEHVQKVTQYVIHTYTYIYINTYVHTLERLISYQAAQLPPEQQGANANNNWLGGIWNKVQYVCTYVCMYVCICRYCVCMSVRMYVCMQHLFRLYVCMYVCNQPNNFKSIH